MLRSIPTTSMPTATSASFCFSRVTTPTPFRSFAPRSSSGLVYGRSRPFWAWRRRRRADGKSALADLEKAFPKLQEEKIQIDTGMELIEIYSGAGDLDKAAAIVSTLRRLYPTNVEVLYASYRIYSDLAGESMLTCHWWLRNLPGCVRSWRTRWRNMGMTKGRSGTTAKLSSSIPSFPDSILNWRKC